MLQLLESKPWLLTHVLFPMGHSWQAKLLNNLFEVQPLILKTSSAFPRPLRIISAATWGRQKIALQPLVDHGEMLLPKPGHHLA